MSVLPAQSKTFSEISKWGTKCESGSRKLQNYRRFGMFHHYSQPDIGLWRSRRCPCHCIAGETGKRNWHRPLWFYVNRSFFQCCQNWIERNYPGFIIAWGWNDYLGWIDSRWASLRNHGRQRKVTIDSFSPGQPFDWPLALLRHRAPIVIVWTIFQCKFFNLLKGNIFP